MECLLWKHDYIGNYTGLNLSRRVTQQRVVNDLKLLITLLSMSTRKNISSRISSNSEAQIPDFLENLEEISSKSVVN